jgi:N-acetylglucosaminyldiphosphoundecaprenol N-acetyl-beta-D-mannosaminyltransferase
MKQQCFSRVPAEEQASEPISYGESSQPLISRRNAILGIEIDFISYRDVFTAVGRWRANGDRRYIVVANPHSLYLAQKDREMGDALRAAGLTVPDGIGVLVAGQLLCHPTQGRVAGPTLVLRLCDWGRAERYRHYFYGGREGVAEQMAARLETIFPSMEIAGFYTPPFSALTEREDADVIAKINRARPDVVWVGLGAPKQEKWMAAHAGKIQCPAMIGVGAAFDFHSGNAPWAPSWVRAAGLEWSFRALREPRRVGPKAMHGLRLVFNALQCRLSSTFPIASPGRLK